MFLFFPDILFASFDKKYASQNILTSLISDQYFWILCLDKHNKCDISETCFLALKKAAKWVPLKWTIKWE